MTSIDSLKISVCACFCTKDWNDQTSYLLCVHIGADGAAGHVPELLLLASGHHPNNKLMRWALSPPPCILSKIGIFLPVESVGSRKNLHVWMQTRFAATNGHPVCRSMHCCLLRMDRPWNCITNTSVHSFQENILLPSMCTFCTVSDLAVDSNMVYQHLYFWILPLVDAYC